MGFGFSLGGSKNKTKTSNNVTVDDWSKGLFENALGGLSGLISQPAQAYGGPLTAGANQYQNQAAETLKGLLSFKPQEVTAQSFKGADLSGYMDPQLENLIDSTKAGIERTRQVQQVADAQDATAAGAWNGGRHGVANALTNEAAIRNSTEAEAGLRSQAFDRAAGLFQADANRQLQADTYNAGSAMQANQMGLQGAGLLGQFGSDMRNQDQAGLDRQYAEFQRLYEDPLKRAQLQLGLLGTIPIGWDSQGTSKGWNIGGSISAGFGGGGAKGG